MYHLRKIFRLKCSQYWLNYCDFVSCNYAQYSLLPSKLVVICDSTACGRFCSVITFTACSTPKVLGFHSRCYCLSLVRVVINISFHSFQTPLHPLYHLHHPLQNLHLCLHLHLHCLVSCAPSCGSIFCASAHWHPPTSTLKYNSANHSARALYLIREWVNIFLCYFQLQLLFALIVMQPICTW